VLFALGPAESFEPVDERGYGARSEGQEGAETSQDLLR
jgi:hypothetical protein